MLVSTDGFILSMRARCESNCIFSTRREQILLLTACDRSMTSSQQCHARFDRFSVYRRGVERDVDGTLSN
jgi:hypothetical protein